MSVIDRFGKVVKAEWSHRFGRSVSPAPSSSSASVESTTSPPEQPASSRSISFERRPAVVDVSGALRVLELQGSPTLDEVRARYRELARRYHPKSGSMNPDEAHAARVVLDALTDAMELLEEHLLPL